MVSEVYEGATVVLVKDLALNQNIKIPAGETQ